MVREHPTLSSGYSQTSGVPPDNPQEQVLRGPAGEEAVGGQQGVLQPKVPQPMNVNSTTSSLLPPASLQQQVLRGPAGEEAGGGQVSHQQLHSRNSETSYSTLLPTSSFRSMDIRENQFPVSETVQNFNRFCWQKPAGSYSLPHQVDSE